MLFTKPSTAFQVTAYGFPTGLTGTLGVRLIKASNQATTIARTTAGIVESPASSGQYIATITAPAAEGRYLAFFDTGTVSPSTSGSEDVIVDSAATAYGAIQVDLTGPGAVSHTHSVEDDDGDPLDGVEVWITTGTDPAVGVQAYGTTDSSGEVTFLLDAGDYYLWQQLAGHDFSNPIEITVSA